MPPTTNKQNSLKFSKSSRLANANKKPQATNEKNTPQREIRRKSRSKNQSRSKSRSKSVAKSNSKFRSKSRSKSRNNPQDAKDIKLRKFAKQLCDKQKERTEPRFEESRLSPQHVKENQFMTSGVSGPNVQRIQGEVLSKMFMDILETATIAKGDISTGS